MEEKTTINMAGIKETLLSAGAIDKDGNVINKETYFKVLETMERETNAAIEDCYVDGVLKKSDKYTANMLYDKLEMIRVLKKSKTLDYEGQKAAEAARKEEKRINAPSMIDKFMKGVRALKDKMQKKNKNTRVQNTQKTR